MACSAIYVNTMRAGALDSSPIVVGATYYGGEFDEARNSWIIDNTDQCSRIAAGEFSAESLAAIVADTCDDDSGLGYLDDTSLHNRVSFAELSNPPGYGDFSALGNLEAGARVEINYRGRCVVAEKLDVGTGGYGVGAYPRAIDLWWQTARTLGFTNGFDTVTVHRVSGGTPLSALGKTSACSESSTPASAPISKKGPQKNTAAPSPSPNVETVTPIESSTDTSSKAYVVLPESDAVQYGPRPRPESVWLRFAPAAVVILFASVELALAVAVFRRKGKAKKYRNVKLWKSHR